MNLFEKRIDPLMVSDVLVNTFNEQIDNVCINEVFNMFMSILKI